MNEAIEHRVSEAEAGERIDRIVAGITGTSRAAAKELIESGAVLADGARVAAAVRPAAGTTLEVRRPEAPEELAVGTAPFTVVHEDVGFLVVDKPAGVVVHPGAGHESDTLVNALAGPYPELRALGPERSWGLVHRLDKETSGLLIVAREAGMRQRLQAQLRRRDITRRYLGLSTGRRFENATGTVEAPIGRDPSHPTRMAVVPDGRPARTHYVRLATWPGYTLLEVTLDTGRTHQIRVHLAAISAPVAGDRVYGGGRAAGSLSMDRVWLHAVRLVFTHPESGHEVDVRSPLPPDLRDTLEQLGPPVWGEIPAASLATGNGSS